MAFPLYKCPFTVSLPANSSSRFLNDTKTCKEVLEISEIGACALYDLELEECMLKLAFQKYLNEQE